MNDLSKRMAERIDAEMKKAIIGTANIVSKPQEPLTLETLQRALAKLPKRDTWLSSRLFPSHRAFTVEGGTEKFMCAHPGFWARVRDAERQMGSTRTANPFLCQPMTDSVIEIDAWPEDSAETAAWRADHWRRLREAVEVAMIPLPEWLRGAPKFGKHG